MPQARPISATDGGQYLTGQRAVGGHESGNYPKVLVVGIDDDDESVSTRARR
jgi:hypothetical protein